MYTLTNTHYTLAKLCDYVKWRLNAIKMAKQLNLELLKIWHNIIHQQFCLGISWNGAPKCHGSRNGLPWKQHARSAKYGSRERLSGASQRPRPAGRRRRHGARYSVGGCPKPSPSWGSFHQQAESSPYSHGKHARYTMPIIREWR